MKPLYPRLATVMAVSLLIFPTVAQGTSVTPGFDLFQTDPTTSYLDFGVQSLPPNFFDPGSDTFSEMVHFLGNPLLNHPACPGDDLSEVDTIIKRLDEATLPNDLASVDVIPIEIVALSLRSTEPITVTYNGGLNPELWDLEVKLSDTLPQPQGTMTIRHTHPLGGAFDSSLPVLPRITFTRQSDNAIRELDFGGLGMAPVDFETLNAPWQHVVPPEGSCTSNFCVNPHQQTVGSANLAAHGVYSNCPEEPTPTIDSSWGRMKSVYR